MMLKHLLFLFVFVSFESNTQAQNPEQILKTSQAKCLAIKNGYYDLHMRMKFMDSKDTSWDLEEKFYFNKLKKDSIYSIAFNSELFSHGNYIRNRLYNGDYFVTYSKTDSTGKIMAKSKWADKIKEDSHNQIASFYYPFTIQWMSPIPDSGLYSDGKHFFRFIGKEMVNGMNCFHVQMMYFPKYDSSDIVHSIKEKTDYWINTKDMLPIKYSIQARILQYGDTLSEYRSLTLKKYSINHAQNLTHLQLSAIPSYCRISDYTAAKKIDLLPENSSAPLWTSISPDGNAISLSNFKGKLVLTDFFYKSCYACMKATPELESLYKKYKKKGLQVIGIDPVDSLNDEIRHFIKKAGIAYPVAIDEKRELPLKYHVTGYPTIYLISKEQKVIFAIDGYNESLEGKLEKRIKSNL